MQAGHAEIVGAGFGGLVAAIALAERGWRVRVHERRGSLEGEGYGIAVHDNMARIFARFGLLERVLAAGMRIDRRDSLDAGGKVVMSRPTARSPYRIDRARIIALLAERARAAGAELRFDATVTRVTPEGTIVLQDGTRREADLVVVADGINSALRDQLGLAARRHLGRDCGVRLAIPRRADEIEADARTGTVMIEAWSEKRRVLFCPVRRTELYVLLTCLVRDAKAVASPIDPDVWARSFPTLHPLFERLRRDADWPRSHWARFDTISLARWSSGRAAVIGDAAHAMAPYLAQGAGHAMMNALGLAAALEACPDLASAFEQWERRERPLTEHTQRWTRIYGATMLLPTPLKRAFIRLERIPWVAAQYLRVANHVPTGTEAGMNVS